ncbi:TPA: hypothetical protein OMU21_004866 [Klebsiella aerogenes]|nr:hypothetical protein [Klebsiella aerogenes]
MKFNHKSFLLHPPSRYCVSIILTGEQYKILTRKLKNENINRIIKKYPLEDKNVLSCILNNIKKDTLSKGRKLKQLNLRCDNNSIEKIEYYENMLGHSADAILRCILLTVNFMI